MFSLFSISERETCRHLGELVMAEANRVPAVKISLKNEMYPTFNFLRRRLFSIYTRLKAFIGMCRVCVCLSVSLATKRHL